MQRRWILVVVGLGAAALFLWAAGVYGPSLPNAALADLASRSGEPRPCRAEEIHRKLDRLLQLRAEHGFDDVDLFAPGLSTQEIRRAMESEGLSSTPQIEALYTWRNGSDAGEVFGLFRSGRLLSLAEALAERRAMRRFGYDSVLFDPKARDLLPVAGFDGGYVLLPLRDLVPTGPARRAIWAMGDGEWAPYYLSLEHMIDTHLEWYRQGHHVPEGLVVDQETEMRVWNEINPGLF